jgi:hypothetical protein
MDDIDPRDQDDDEIASEELEADIMRADHAPGTRFGTTAEEAVAGEGLDRALAQEIPEPDRADEDLEIVDEAGPDVEAELVGDEVRGRDPFTPPEDAAMTIVDEAPGATDHAERGEDDPDPEAVERHLDENDR